MNIFYLDPSPEISAKMMSNKHIVKMILESAQMLCTAHNLLDGVTSINDVVLYKPTHKNHPSSIWTRSNIFHYQWLYSHFESLHNEYINRYNKNHKTFITLSQVLSKPPINIPKNNNFKLPPTCMPDIYKTTSVCESYQKYYKAEKFFTPEDEVRFFNVKNSLWRKQWENLNLQT